MRKVILSMMMSLDGFAAGPNGEMDWLPPFDDEEKWRDLHGEMWKQLKGIDTFLLGRVTYQQWEYYWPAAAKNPKSTRSDIDFSRFADETQKVVFSKTLNEVHWKNSRLVKGDIAEEIGRMKQMPGKDIALAGGAGLARTFIKLGLVDDYLFTVHPVILGTGKSLFKDLEERRRLRLVEARTLNPGAVLLHYQPQAGGANL
jgi:dihydrofolate reductase